jgi:hypothetical protein
MKMDFTEIYSHFDGFLKELDNKKGLIANNSNKTVSQSKLVNCNELLTPYCNELLTPLGSIKTVKIQLSFKFKYILILIKI